MTAHLPTREDVDALTRAALPDTSIDPEGAARLLAFLDALPPPVLPRVDELLRDDYLRRWHWSSFGTWDRTPGEWRSELLSWMRAHADDLLRAPGLLGALAGGADGHVREYATRLLARVHHQVTTGLLLVRLSDWARPVREAAREALHARLTSGYVMHWARWLALVDRLEVVERGDDDLVEGVRELLRSPGGQAAMREVLPDADGLTRAALLTVVEALPDGERAAWLSTFGRDALASLRRRVVRLAPVEGLEGFLVDSDAGVRQEALRRLLDAHPEGVPDFLRAALLDPRTGVRALAQYEARQRGVDLRDAYLAVNEHTLSVSHLRGWAGGLRDVGGEAALPRLRALLSHPNTRVRSAALLALGTLAARDHEAELEAALLRSGREADAAASALLAADLVTPDRLARAWAAATTDEMRRRLVRLAVRLPRFDALVLLLTWRANAADELHVRLVDAARELVSGFGRRYYTRPNAEQRALLARLINIPGQDETVAATLRTLLG